MPKKGPSTVEERLHRVEGQIRGIEKLIQEKQPTEKIMIQLQAAISSLESIKVELIKKEVRESLLHSLDSVIELIK